MRYFFVLLYALFIGSCGQESDEGFLSDFNICIWEEGDGYYGQQLNTSQADTSRALNDSGTNKYLGQSFTLSEDKQFWGIEIYLNRTAMVPTSGFSIEILEDSSNSPDADNIRGYSGIVLYDQITTSASWARIQFSEVPILDGNRTYWIKLIPKYNADGARYIEWQAWSGGNTMKYSSSGTGWATANMEGIYRFLPCR